MKQSDTYGTPTLVVVTGRPGSGKTTLAYRLAREIRCPLISRDELKEGLINTVHKNEAPEANLDGFVYRVYFETLERLLRNHITLVTEAAFQHKLWSAKLLSLQRIASVKLICCAVNAELAKKRFIERASTDLKWSLFHEDLSELLNADISSTLIGQYEPPKLDIPTLTVDTSEGYQPNLVEVISFLELAN
jgi:predicted kinase